jgi:dipeptidyl aminopeptidase/acylaminoacyl peptidase
MPAPLSPEVLTWGLVLATDPQISPDGSSIVYARVSGDVEARRIERQLWSCGRSGDEQRRLTWRGSENTQPRWSPDGTKLAFTSNRVEPFTSLCILEMGSGGEAREIVRQRRGIANPAWSPDGERLAYVSEVDPANPDENVPDPSRAPAPVVVSRIDYREDGRGVNNEVRSQIFVAGARDGERRQLTDGPDDRTEPAWSPDGRYLAALARNHVIYSQLSIIEVETGSERLVGPADGAVSSFAWSPSGARILFAAELENSGQPDFYLYDLEDDATRPVTAGIRPVPVSAPVWLDEHALLVDGVERAASGLYRLDVRDGSLTLLKRWEVLNFGFSVDQSKRFVVQSQTSLDRLGEAVSSTPGGDLVVHDLQEDISTVVTDLNRGVLSRHPMAEWERLDVERGDFTVEAWLLKPPGFDPAARYPILVDVHGGPESWYGYGCDLFQQCLATNGFVVVFCNPRGSTSYGPEFARQVHRDWGGGDWRDILAVLDAVLEHPWADGERTGIYGFSYGGYMTAWAIGQTRRFKAAVAGECVSDLLSSLGTADIDFVDWRRSYPGLPAEHFDWYVERSPVTYLHQAATPTLVLCGENDQRCPINQSEQLYMRLKLAGCETEFVRYPGGDHWWCFGGGEPEHRQDVMERMLAWFTRHLAEPAL